MEYNEIAAAYKAKYSEGKAAQKALDDQATKARNDAMRHARLAAQKMGQYNKLRKKANTANTASWTKDVVKPLMEEVSRRTGIEFDLNDLRTFGIRANCPVFSTEKDKEKEVYVNFTNIDVRDCILHIDTGETKKRFPEGSIGQVNGFNNSTEEVVSVDTVIDNLRRRFPWHFNK